MTPGIKPLILTSLMASFVMALFFSGFFTFLSFGATARWLAAWGRGFAIGWPLGFLISSSISPPIRKLALRFSRAPSTRPGPAAP